MLVKHALLAACVMSGLAVGAEGAARAQTLPSGNRLAPASPWTLERPKPAPAPVPAVSVADPAAPPRTPEVDLSALRYYASQNDSIRIAAEIRRLRATYPAWEPPSDLFTDAKNTQEEQPLWDLFGRHDYAGVRSKIAQMQEKTPDWQPSADLMNKLTLGEARDRLVQASNHQAWDVVIDVAANNNGLMTCADLDTMWRTAEALVRSNDEPHALDAYRYMLSSCTKPGERLATMQKAALLLKTPGAAESLMALGTRDADGRDEFEQVRLDAVRRKIGAAAAGPVDAAAMPTPADVDAIAQDFARRHDVSDAQLLGWYAYARKDFPQAETWFKTAMAVKADAKPAEGLVLTLRDAGKQDEAESVAFASRDLDHLNRKLMIELFSAHLLDPKAAPVPLDRIAALAEAIDTDKSADGAQAYGWYLYKRNDIAGAQGWFRKSADWQDGESAAIGLVVCANRLNQKADLTKLVTRYKDAYPRIAELDVLMRPHRLPASYRRVAGADTSKAKSHEAKADAKKAADGGDANWDKSADAIVKTFQSGGYDQAMAMLDTRRQQKAEPRGLALVRGWSLYQRGDWNGASKVFAEVGSKGGLKEAQEGLRVIQAAETPQRYR